MTYTPGPARYSGLSTTTRTPQVRSSLFTLNSAATTNATGVKSGSAFIQNIQAHNAAVAARWLRIYNTAGTPVVGTDTPVMIIHLPASSSKEIQVGDVSLSLGLGIAITGAVGVLDATAVAAGDVQVAISYD